MQERSKTEQVHSIGHMLAQKENRNERYHETIRTTILLVAPSCSYLQYFLQKYYFQELVLEHIFRKV